MLNNIWLWNSKWRTQSQKRSSPIRTYSWNETKFVISSFRTNCTLINKTFPWIFHKKKIYCYTQLFAKFDCCSYFFFQQNTVNVSRSNGMELSKYCRHFHFYSLLEKSVEFSELVLSVIITVSKYFALRWYQFSLNKNCTIVLFFIVCWLEFSEFSNFRFFPFIFFEIKKFSSAHTATTTQHDNNIPHTPRLLSLWAMLSNRICAMCFFMFPVSNTVTYKT